MTTKQLNTAVDQLKLLRQMAYKKALYAFWYFDGSDEKWEVICRMASDLITVLEQDSNYMPF